MLDMIAMEMAAPDTDAAYEPKLDDAEVDESQIHANQMDDPGAARARNTRRVLRDRRHVPGLSDANDAAASQRDAASAARPEPALRTRAGTWSPWAQLAPEPAPSLGSSLIANGIVPRPRASRPDPLAPIRRMSQTEKIAFFS